MLRALAAKQKDSMSRATAGTVAVLVEPIPETHVGRKMNEQREQDQESESVKNAAQTATERSESIRKDVHDITLRALSHGRLDVKRVTEVVRAVMEGASIGAQAKGEQLEVALKEAMGGLDEALAKSAEASKLAIEETAGHVKDFGSHDLKQAVENLQSLEELFVDTVQDVAKGTNHLARGVLGDLVSHARQSGTSAGRTAYEAATSLNQQLAHTVKDTASAGAHATLEVTAHIASAAAGILEGIADSLHSGTRKKPDQE